MEWNDGRVYRTPDRARSDRQRRLHPEGPHWYEELLEAPELGQIARWCFDYFDEEGRAPDRDIKDIYMEKMKYGKISKNDEEYIEGVLTKISEDFEHGEQFNANRLWKQTKRYIRNRDLKLLSEEIDILTEQGREEEAEELRRTFQHRRFDIDDDPFAWKQAFRPTDDLIEMIQTTKVLLGVYPESQITVLSGMWNAGKTTFNSRYAAPRLVRLGKKVTYINADFPGSDLREFDRLAKDGGYDFLAPDYTKHGVTRADILTSLERMGRQDNLNLTDELFIIATLKKFTDLMSKNAVKNMFDILGRLRAKGMTLVVEANTNKLLGPDGKLRFEGVGDVASETDNLLYLESKKFDDKSMVLSIDPREKVRALIEQQSFNVSSEREVSRRHQYADISELTETINREKDDEPIIAAIKEWLDEHNKGNQKDVLKHLKETGTGAYNKNVRILNEERYREKHWTVSPGKNNQEKLYRPIGGGSWKDTNAIVQMRRKRQVSTPG